MSVRARGLYALGDVPLPVSDAVVAEAGAACIIPRCDRAPAKLVALQPTAPPSVDNLVPVCSNHSKVNQGVVTMGMLRHLKALTSRITRIATGEVLRTRRDYLQAVVDTLRTQPKRVLLTYVGPLCLHPDWYFDRRSAAHGLPDMDREVRTLLRSYALGEGRDVRVIFRNSPRYIDKVNEIVKPDDRQRLIDDVLREIDTIWGRDGRQGPAICCLNAGHFHIPLIFDSSVIVASRASSGAPITDGFLRTDSETVKWEEEKFSALFKASSRGQAEEVLELRMFVASLWS